MNITLCFLWPAWHVRLTTCRKRVLQGVYSHHITINPLQSRDCHRVRGRTSVKDPLLESWSQVQRPGGRHQPVTFHTRRQQTGGWALVLIFNRGNISRLCFRPAQVWLKGNGGVIASSNLLKRKLLVGVWAAASAAAASVSQLIGRGKRVLHLFTWWALQQPQKRWI